MKGIASVAGTLLGGIVLLFHVGCLCSSEFERAASPRYRRAAMESECPAALPHGGTATVNDAPAAAMFFKNYGTNPFVDADEDRFSTFAVDVDTASYALMRRYLRDGHLPPEAAVRVEEFVNAFDYGYTAPRGSAFAIHLEGAPSPFRKHTHLLRIALKGREIPPERRKDAVLTFVIDVSGSMGREDRLGRVKESLRFLVGRLREGDRVAIVAYGSSAWTVLPPTGAEKRDTILEALADLTPHGSTNAEEGLVLGYSLAEEAFQRGAINRVILCSDGVANVGRTGPRSILERIGNHARRGIFLTALGFGMGNYNDVLMEQLGDKGNGHYAYIDTLEEAKQVFGEGITGTLQVIARDVKIQVAFDPGQVRSYRLLGYENRDVADRAFRDDSVDGGEVGAGHSVTALYEVKLWGEKEGPLARVHVRYRDPDEEEVREAAASFWTSNLVSRYESTTPEFRLAAVVARFAEVLRGSYWAMGTTLADVRRMAEDLPFSLTGDRKVREFQALVTQASGLKRAF
ncbi:MAG: vWA domain-containing protein [Planctomycetota bacterium]